MNSFENLMKATDPLSVENKQNQIRDTVQEHHKDPCIRDTAQEHHRILFNHLCSESVLLFCFFVMSN